MAALRVIRGPDPHDERKHGTPAVSAAPPSSLDTTGLARDIIARWRPLWADVLLTPQTGPKQGIPPGQSLVQYGT